MSGGLDAEENGGLNGKPLRTLWKGIAFLMEESCGVRFKRYGKNLRLNRKSFAGLWKEMAYTVDVELFGVHPYI